MSALEIVLTGRATRKDGYWSATEDQFKITTYGATREEALDRLNTAVGLVVERLAARGAENVRIHLSKVGIASRDVDDSAPEPSTLDFKTVKRIGTGLVPA
jgi:predicted RNase H-like HicB family nuclease